MDPEANDNDDDWGDGGSDLDDDLELGQDGPDDGWDHDGELDAGEYVDHYDSGYREGDGDWALEREASDPDVSEAGQLDEPMEFKRRLEAAPVQATPIQWKLWAPVLIAIGLAAGAVAAWALVSGDNNRGDLRVVSTQELLTPECSWTIAYEMENTTDVPLQAVDTRVVANGLTLFVTQAAPDVVIGPNSTFTNTIVYGIPDCPASAEELDHGPIEVFYANSNGRGETLSAGF